MAKDSDLNRTDLPAWSPLPMGSPEVYWPDGSRFGPAGEAMIGPHPGTPQVPCLAVAVVMFNLTTAVVCCMPIYERDRMSCKK